MAAIFARKMVIPAGKAAYIAQDITQFYKNMFFSEALVLLNYEIE